MCQGSMLCLQLPPAACLHAITAALVLVFACVYVCMCVQAHKSVFCFALL